MYALLAALVLSQTVYEWTDSKGVQHFTDDPSSIPKGVKARTTKGAELNTVSVDAATPATPTATPPVKPGPNGCSVAQARVTELEKGRADQAQALSRLREDEARRCREVLATQGQGGYAVCTAGIEERAAAAGAQQTKDLSAQLEAAREALRKAQLDGCR